MTTAEILRRFADDAHTLGVRIEKFHVRLGESRRASLSVQFETPEDEAAKGNFNTLIGRTIRLLNGDPDE